jgi:hypothetical protein
MRRPGAKATEDTLIHSRLYRRGTLRSPKGLAEEGKMTSDNQRFGDRKRLTYVGGCVRGWRSCNFGSP